MVKTKTLYGVNFELGKAIKGAVRPSHRNLFDCYNRPSETKKAIYDDWYNWFIHKADSYDFGVSSYNYNFFSIDGLVTDESGNMYYLVITRAHNRAYPIER